MAEPRAVSPNTAAERAESVASGSTSVETPPAPATARAAADERWRVQLLLRSEDGGNLLSPLYLHKLRPLLHAHLVRG